MQPNEVRVTRLVTVATGTSVASSKPNALPLAASFEVILEVAAGSTIGNSGGAYTLELTCVDETLAAPNAVLGFVDAQIFDAGDGWNPDGGAAGNYVKVQRFPFPVPAAVRRHVLRYTVTLTNTGGTVAAFGQSESFILV
ncbi:hypothetical protein [Streptomyces sp. NPDC053079]|uniref:hypothetical protein n=1 Tax=Streptomyces sp. NPDC053079 TaxID=3365697 RepID=UPI0037D83A99